jgi:hypothetical protein
MLDNSSTTTGSEADGNWDELIDSGYFLGTSDRMLYLEFNDTSTGTVTPPTVTLTQAPEVYVGITVTLPPADPVLDFSLMQAM